MSFGHIKWEHGLDRLSTESWFMDFYFIEIHLDNDFARSGWHVITPSHQTMRSSVIGILSPQQKCSKLSQYNQTTQITVNSLI